MSAVATVVGFSVAVAACVPYEDDRCGCSTALRGWNPRWGPSLGGVWVYRWGSPSGGDCGLPLRVTVGVLVRGLGSPLSGQGRDGQGSKASSAS
eukprot:9467451-Pyramimonas_sp.AAC.1